MNPDYLGDNIQNALVVDLLQTTNGNGFQPQSNDRQFLTENDLVEEVQIHHELNEANDSRVKQALLQYINKNYQNPTQIITTDHHVVNVKVNKIDKCQRHCKVSNCNVKNQIPKASRTRNATINTNSKSLQLSARCDSTTDTTRASSVERETR